MKVSCPQCGRQFDIPDAQANRLLKCLCKSLFRPQSTPTKELPIDVQASPNSEIPDIQLKVSRSSYYTDEASEASESSLSNSQISTFLSDLKSNRDQVFTQTSKPESKPSPKIVIQEIELGESKVERKPKAEVASQAGSISHDEVLPTVEISKVRNTKAVAQATSSTVKVTPPNQSKVSVIHQKRTLLEKWQLLKWPMKAGIISGAVAPLMVIAIVMSREEQVVHEMDPTLVRLLSPQKAAPTKPAPPVEQKAETKINRENSSQKSVEPSAPSPAAARFKEIQAAFFAGQFENLIRIAANAEGSLSSEELALMFESQLIRAERNQERIQEIETEIQAALQKRDQPPSLLRSLSAAQLRNIKDPKALSLAFQKLKSLSLTRSRDPIVFAYLGMVYERMDRLDLAHQSWEQALNLESQFVWLLERREQVYRVLKDFQNAERMAKRISEIPGAEALGFELLAKLAEAQGQPDRAAAAYRSALKYKDDPETRLAATKVTKEKSASDLEKIAKAAKSPQARAQAYYELGNHYCSAKNYNLGVNYFRKAIQERSNYFEAHKARALCELASGQRKRAIESFERALKHNEKDAELWRLYGLSLYKDGKARASIAALQRSLALSPTDMAHFALAEIFKSQKKRAEALVHAKKAAKINPKNSQAKELVTELER